MEIKTNRLKYSIDHYAFDKKYELYKVTTSESYFKAGAQILDSALLENNVQSVLFEKGKSFYCLMILDIANKKRLLNAIQETGDREKVHIEKIESKSMLDHQLIQLLLNGIGSTENEYLKMNNLTGHLYCFHPDWIVHGKGSTLESVLKIPCLEISVNDKYNIKLSVRTFSSVLLIKKITFPKKRFEEYPKYVFSEKNTLRRKLKEDNESSYIMRQTDNARTEITFLNIQSLEKFEKSKMGVLRKIKYLFNRKYEGICSLDFDTVTDSVCINHEKKVDRRIEKTIVDRLAKNSIHFVDSIGDNYSNDFLQNIALLLFQKYGIKASIGKRLKKEALNIKLIHNADHYIDCEDPHDQPHAGNVIQHITFEDYCWDSGFALRTIINELLIKEDLQKGKITLFDWNELELGEVSFGISETVDGSDRYFFMNVHKDGSFDISEQKLDLFSMNEYDRLLKLFEDSRTCGKNICGLVKDECGNINAIVDTDWITIPEIDKLYFELTSGNNKLRGKESRNALMSASLDIHSFVSSDNTGTYYFVGDIGEGMRPEVQRAANIRKIEYVDGAPDLFTKLMPLMDVTFVRNGQLTVVPFPFKYLREYVRSLFEKITMC